MAGRKTIELCYEKGYVTSYDLYVLEERFVKGKLSSNDIMWAAWRYFKDDVEAADQYLDDLEKRTGKKINGEPIVITYA